MTNFLERSARLIFGKLLPHRPYRVVRGPLRGYRFILGAAAGEAVDVGANVGYYTLFASRIVGRGGRVLAIEPAPRNVAYLRRHVQINRCANVTILPIACADVAGVEAFASGHNAATGHLVLSPSPGTPGEGRGEGSGRVSAEASPHPNPLPEYRAREKSETVSTEPLDLCAQRLHVSPHVIKIDVEGAELHVLRGASNLLRIARPHVLLSTHSDALRDECLRFLEGFDYVTTPLDASAAEFSASPRT
jgi:FkbM family methyltransferase